MTKRMTHGISWESMHPQANRIDVYKWGSEEGLLIPDEYIAFLEHVNGGIPSLPVAPNGSGSRTLIRTFSAWKGDEAEDDLAVGFRCSVERDVPWGFLPIAVDWGDNIFFLECRQGVANGRVYFLDKGLWDGTPNFHNLACVANSFSAFLRTLQPEA